MVLASIAVSFAVILIFYQYNMQPTVQNVLNESLDNKVSLENTNDLAEKYNGNYDYEDFVLDYNLFGDREKINSPYISEFQLPNGTWPLGILVDNNGIVWIGGTKSHKLLEYDPKYMKIIESFSLRDKDSGITDNTITENPAMIWSIVQDNDDLIWISQTGKNPLWIFDKKTNEFEVRRDVTSSAIQMQVDKNSGDIWFTDTDQDILGIIQKTVNNTRHISEFKLGQDSFPFGLYLADDGTIWITESTNHKILGFNKTMNNGLISGVTKNFELSQSNKTVFYYPSDLIILGDKLWFTEHLASYFLEYDLASKDLTRYPTSINPRQYGTLPFWMIKDQQGRGFWFVEHFGNRIAFFETENKTLTEYEIPSRDPAWNYVSNAIDMVVDPNNPDKLWFSEFYIDKIGVVDRSTSIPFEITITSDNLNINKKEKNQTVIDFTVKVTQSEIPIKNNTIFLKKSSSIVASAGFGNMTAKIEPDHFEVSSLGSFEGRLILSDIKNLANGNYTIAISATDGSVARTDYTFLTIN